MTNWTRPRKHDSGQLFLFCAPVDELLAKLRASHDDTRRWHELGWLSFEINEHDELQPPLEWELIFICSLARSGLNDAQVNELLESLEKPYRYNPESIAYHFGHGWVSPPPEAEPYDVIDESLDDYLTSLVENGETEKLLSLQEQINDLLNCVEEEND